MKQRDNRAFVEMKNRRRLIQPPKKTEPAGLNY